MPAGPSPPQTWKQPRAMTPFMPLRARGPRSISGWLRPFGNAYLLSLPASSLQFTLIDFRNYLIPTLSKKIFRSSLRHHRGQRNFPFPRISHRQDDPVDGFL